MTNIHVQGGQIDMEKVPVVCIVGPTAVGKTAASLLLAEVLGGEIVSADSMQVYRYMDIGTAKLPLRERRGIPHHMIDVVDPRISFSVHDYAEMARKSVWDIWQRGRVPVIVGGTGLYVRALVDHFDFTDTQSQPQLRESLRREADVQGLGVLHTRLQRLDPEAAHRIHPNDGRRIIRALEVNLSTGCTMKANYQAQDSPFAAIMVGLTTDRPELYARIDRRVDQMVEAGLVDEVRALMEIGCTEAHSSMQAIGYKEFIGVVEGWSTMTDAVEAVKQSSRRYAKRQLSWFQPDPRIDWYAFQEDDIMLAMRSSGMLDHVTTALQSLR